MVEIIQFIGIRKPNLQAKKTEENKSQFSSDLAQAIDKLMCIKAIRIPANLRQSKNYLNF